MNKCKTNGVFKFKRNELDIAQAQMQIFKREKNEYMKFQRVRKRNVQDP